MKKTIILLFTAALYLQAYSQYQHAYGTQGDESGQSIRRTYFDEGYVIGGYSDYKFMPGYDAILSKVSKNGYINWTAIYGGEGSDYFNSVRLIGPDKYRGYVALGSTNSLGVGAFDMLMIRTDTIGRPVSVFTYGEDQYEGGYCIQVVKNPETERSELIMIGHSSSYFPVIDKKMFIVKTTLTGKYLDAIVFGDDGAHAGYWIEQTGDGGFIAVGTTSNSCCCGPDYDVENYNIFIVKLNYSLDVEWARTIGGKPGLYDDDVANSVKETKDGYIITGYTESFSNNNYKDVFIIKLDKKGGFKWLRNYGTTGEDTGNDILNVENPKLEYQYIVNGKTTIDGVNYALLLATDSYGNLKWSKAYGMNKDDELGLEMDRTGKNGYTFTGSVKSFGQGQRDIYHVVTDIDGNSNCPFCETKIKMSSSIHKPCIKQSFKYRHIQTGMKQRIDYKYIKLGQDACRRFIIKQANDFTQFNIAQPGLNKLNIYPNPTSKLIHIEYPVKYQNGYLQIFNNTGQLVMTRQLTEPASIDITVNSFENGIYMIRVRSKNGESIKANFLKIK